MNTVINEVKAERAVQDAKWGGPEHDDKHSAQEFVGFIEAQLRKCERGTGPDTRERLIKVAALAVAAVEMIDRTTRYYGSEGCNYHGRHFGSIYPDARCIDGYLFDEDSCDEPGGGLRVGGEIPCPQCCPESYAEYMSGEDADEGGAE